MQNDASNTRTSTGPALLLVFLLSVICLLAFRERSFVGLLTRLLSPGGIFLLICIVVAIRAERKAAQRAIRWGSVIFTVIAVIVISAVGLELYGYFLARADKKKAETEALRQEERAAALQLEQFAFRYNADANWRKRLGKRGAFDQILSAELESALPHDKWVMLIGELHDVSAATTDHGVVVVNNSGRKLYEIELDGRVNINSKFRFSGLCTEDVAKKLVGANVDEVAVIAAVTGVNMGEQATAGDEEKTRRLLMLSGAVQDVMPVPAAARGKGVLDALDAFDLSQK